MKTKRGNTGDKFGRVLDNPQDTNTGEHPLADAVLASYFAKFGKPDKVRRAGAFHISGHRWRITCWTEVSEFSLLPTPTACVRCDDEGNVIEKLPDRKPGSFHNGITDPNKRGGRWN